MFKKSLSIFLIVLIFPLISCRQMINFITPAQQATAAKDWLAKKAEKYFWRTLHKGQYKNIDHADYLLMAAYLKNPTDPKLAAHIGFLHIWKLTERQRLGKENPLIVNEMILSKEYFSNALSLDPNNPIYNGFHGDSALVLGQILNNKREQGYAYFDLKKAIYQWPEFNYFTAGYPMSTLPYNSSYYKEAVDWQWKTLDICAGRKVDRANPTFAPYMSRATTKGSQRACWNSWSAPHNFEGFFMNMGDMIVKAGDWKTAIILYKNARLSKTYKTWPYRKMLEKRIMHAQQNVRNFRTRKSGVDHAILFNSGRGCVACHQSV